MTEFIEVLVVRSLRSAVLLGWDGQGHALGLGQEGVGAVALVG